MKFLEDMTPAERARLKLYSHFAIIFVFNFALAALVFFTGNNGPINVYTLVVSLLAQAVLALIDALKKFFTASGEPTISAMLDAARAEVSAKAPPAPAMPAEAAAFQAQVNAALQPGTTGQAIPAVQRPVWLQDLSKTNTPPPPSNVSPVLSPAWLTGAPPPASSTATSTGFITTLPNIAAVQPPPQG